MQIVDMDDSHAVSPFPMEWKLAMCASAILWTAMAVFMICCASVRIRTLAWIMIRRMVRGNQGGEAFSRHRFEVYDEDDEECPPKRD
jgi:hypothetical protein